MNTVSYLYINFAFFNLLFVFNTNKLKSLNDFKFLSNLNFFSITLILLLFSLAGVPPTWGFTSKSTLFLYLFFKKSYIYIIFLTVINFFIMYFYIKNIRHINGKNIINNENNFIFNKNYSFINSNLIIFINFINFINLLSIYFIEDILIFLDNITICCNFL